MLMVIAVKNLNKEDQPCESHIGASKAQDCSAIGSDQSNRACTRTAVTPQKKYKLGLKVVVGHQDPTNPTSSAGHAQGFIFVLGTYTPVWVQCHCFNPHQLSGSPPQNLRYGGMPTGQPQVLSQCSQSPLCQEAPASWKSHWPLPPPQVPYTSGCMSDMHQFWCYSTIRRARTRQREMRNINSIS